MESQTKRKEIMTFIGAIIINASINSIFALNILSVFIISYLHHFDHSVDFSYSYFLFPFCSLGIAIANYIYLLLNKLIHSHMYY